MRTELVNGRWLLCGHFLDAMQIKSGQLWASADGSDRVVRVSGKRGDWVGYTWQEKERTQYHEKSVFAFQCRYCLVLPSETIPKEFQ